MNSDNPVPAARILRLLVAFPFACFTGALMTDAVYALTADMIWADFSAWLLAVGMVAGVIALVVAIVDMVAHRRTRAVRPVWPIALGSLVVLALALLDNLVHSRDAWTSVVPQGLALSAATFIVMLITAWFATSLAYRPGVPVPPRGMRT